MDVSEFITEKREHKKAYTKTTRKDGTKVVIVDHSRVKPSDKFEIEMLVKAGYEIQKKKEDITKDEMLKYVKENYEPKEFEILEKWFEKIGTIENGKKVTFLTVKNLFKDRYIFFPKGKDYTYKNNEEKEQRYKRAFAEHQKELRKEYGSNAEASIHATQTATQETTNQDRPHNDNNKNNNKHHNN